jgi:hypothetical protein
MLHAPVFIGTGEHETRCQILLCAFGHFVFLLRQSFVHRDVRICVLTPRVALQKHLKL